MLTGRVKTTQPSLYFCQSCQGIDKVCIHSGFNHQGNRLLLIIQSRDKIALKQF